MVRLDVWLDVACVFKTRSEAQRACKGGKVLVNGHRVKPHRELQIGDRVEVTRGRGPRRQLIVASVDDSHVPKSMARTMYEDVTPPPTPEEQELLDLLRRAGPRPPTSPRAPDKRDRRTLRRLKRG